tara:strand:- start:972 stop:2114 length:1143 start_codon:yes stop_codon:yes gene_type:complete
MFKEELLKTYKTYDSLSNSNKSELSGYRYLITKPFDGLICNGKGDGDDKCVVRDYRNQQVICITQSFCALCDHIRLRVLFDIYQILGIKAFGFSSLKDNTFYTRIRELSPICKIHYDNVLGIGGKDFSREQKYFKEFEGVYNGICTLFDKTVKRDGYSSVMSNLSDWLGRIGGFIFALRGVYFGNTDVDFDSRCLAWRTCYENLQEINNVNDIPTQIRFLYGSHVKILNSEYFFKRCCPLFKFRKFGSDYLKSVRFVGEEVERSKSPGINGEVTPKRFCVDNSNLKMFISSNIYAYYFIFHIGAVCTKLSSYIISGDTSSYSVNEWLADHTYKKENRKFEFMDALKYLKKFGIPQGIGDTTLFPQRGRRGKSLRQREHMF